MTRIPTVYNPFNYLDLTNLVKNWYAGTYTAEYDAINEDEQYSVILQLASGVSNGYTEFRSAEYNNTYSISPYFSIIYVNSTGLESRFSYSSQGVGRAGTGSVNLFSGNLTVSFADAEINNGTMPISVSHVYNANDKDTDIGYVYVWDTGESTVHKAIKYDKEFFHASTLKFKAFPLTQMFSMALQE